MTKKNLSDLLKEEAQAPAAPTSVEAASSAPTPTKSATTQKAATQKAATKSAINQKASAKSTAARTPSRRGPTKADLEKQVVQLQANLKAATDREATLAKQVEGLKGDLAKQQEHLFELKDALAQAQANDTTDAETLKKVTDELAEAKQVILKMTAETESTMAQSAQAKSESTPAEKPALTVKMRPGGDIYRGRRLPAHKNVPDYAIDHGEKKTSMLTDEEIGWVD
ncbi:MAG: hypothetical protein F6K42_21720 [Leptolyngbya sp. SIO1D8]|nr:hypothetical protein [Leptolyngbya sp. SIO1D8]